VEFGVTPKYLTEEELRGLFSAIKSVRDRAIFTVAFWRGLRASEVALLQVADVRLKVGRIYVHRLKGSRSGEHLLSDEELRVLRAWLRVRGYDPGPLFPSRRRRGISRYQLHRLMKRYGAAAGLAAEKRHFHTLKHSIATWLMGRPDSDIRRVQDWLGHANIQSTVIYAQITSAQRDEFARRVFGRR
jgi:integrase